MNRYIRETIYINQTGTGKKSRIFDDEFKFHRSLPGSGVYIFRVRSAVKHFQVNLLFTESLASLLPQYHTARGGPVQRLIIRMLHSGAGSFIQEQVLKGLCLAVPHPRARTKPDQHFHRPQ